MKTMQMPVVWMAGARYSADVWQALARVEMREQLGDGRTFTVNCQECGTREMHSADGVRAFLGNHARHGQGA